MKKVLFALMAMFSLNACSDDTATITGKTYTLLPEKAITITFDAKESRFYGQAVNNYFGTYKIENNNITLNLAGSTMMAGPAEEMQKERTYFENLSKVKTYTLKNNELNLKGDAVDLKYVEMKD